MIVEYIRYRVPADDLKAFADAWVPAARIVRDDPHCLSCEVTRCVDEPEVHIVRNTWDSAEGHLEGFRKSEAFETFIGHIGQWMSNIDELRHYEVLDTTTLV